MKAIIVYYSHTTNNETLAHEMKLRIGCNVVKIEEQKRRTGFTTLLDLVFRRNAKIKKPNVFLFDYSIVIFIAPIWNAKIATPIKTFIKKEKHHIKKYAFISICSGREGQREKIAKELIQLIQKKPILITELAVDKWLSLEHKKSPKPYLIKKPDLQNFKREIQHFTNVIFEMGSEFNYEKPLMRVESHG
jgi:flavodoxin